MRKPGRSVIAIALLVAGCACRQGRKSPGAIPLPSASPTAVEASDVPVLPPRIPGRRPPVIWLGLDGLDWELLDRLSAEGKMPNWTRLVAEGRSCKLKSFLPMLSPIVWTTIATGVGPDIHGVLDFQELDPKTGRTVPISGLSRQVPAVWDIASSRGLKVGVVGWWASHPAERVNGYFVSDRASPILFAASPGPGVASPPTFDEAVARVVARDGKVAAEELTRYLDVPADEIRAHLAGTAGMEDPIVALARILGATRVNQRLARDLYDRERPDLATV